MKKHLYSTTWLSQWAAVALLVGCAPAAPESPPLAAVRQAAGLAKDGDLSVSIANTIVNRYAVLTADATAGDTTLALSKVLGQGVDALQPLLTDDLLLIIQMQGADIDSSNSASYGAVTALRSSGRFEFVSVASINTAANQITIGGGCGGLKNSYQAAGRVQVIRVPQLGALTVAAGASIVAPAWTGQVGGVVAMQVRDTVTLNGQLSAQGLGFRGGAKNPFVTLRSPGVGSYYRSTSSADGGNRGEGIGGGPKDYALVGAFGRGAAANGGGGGNRINAGGGGGSNSGDLTLWDGQGQMSLAVTGGAAAWLLDPGYSASRAAAVGGGRGGYSYSGAALDPTVVAPGDVTWLEDSRRERGGLGGRPLPSDPKSRLFLGGGGGSGDDYQNSSGAGGNGGGLIFVDADRITGSGSVVADGTSGGSAATNSSGGGGGGGGGTVILAAANGIDGITVSAQGGSGGLQLGATSNGSGPGGGGGGGYIATPPGLQLTRMAGGGSAGTTASTSLTAFPVNGASDGASGVVAESATGPYGGAPFCAVADLSVSLTANPPQATGVDPVELAIAVQNLGPSFTGNVSVRLTLPPLVRLLNIAGSGWVCQGSEQEVVCTLASLVVGAAPALTVTIQPAQGASSMSFTASLSAPSSDPVASNNSASLELANSSPLFARPAGGGLSCSAIPGQPGGGGGLWLLLVATLLRRRRRSAEND